ncbi:hypothetical protein QJS10_CPB22g00359 [Acorus calamus]|uniref:Uncharacterized protein n=1 Tax=Acorus calamus TaxID=4465 RepID=A0AAV9C3U6_ACOCL|nr:hypothetical protein QJS10_CPB22g00359 [Acorus calamus]
MGDMVVDSTCGLGGGLVEYFKLAFKKDRRWLPKWFNEDLPCLPLDYLEVKCGMFYLVWMKIKRRDLTEDVMDVFDELYRGALALEAIAGKCNVLCTSIDRRNPQPSEEELKKADYIFYRTFDVETYSISDKIGDSIAGIEVRFLFNKKGGQTTKGVATDMRAHGVKIENRGTFISSKDRVHSDKSEDATKDVATDMRAHGKEKQTFKWNSGENILGSSTKRKVSETDFRSNQKAGDIVRKNWFKQEPWKDKMKTAIEEGTLVLLQNLDPSYTSRDVEDLISCAFQKRCDARMVQWTTFSIPYSGLREIPEQKYRFVGNLSLERKRFAMQREEMKNAVSTSHCSQPNTIEYEMAMDWEFLQEK